VPDELEKMNKRKFIEFVAAGMASPFLSSLLRAESEKELKNWAGNLEYGRNRLYPARSLEEVQSYVKKQRKMKVLGTRHCFNNIADSTNEFLSLKAMDDVVALEPESRSVSAFPSNLRPKPCPKRPLNQRDLVGVLQSHNPKVFGSNLAPASTQVVLMQRRVHSSNSF
jgi:hypothetical protein